MDKTSAKNVNLYLTEVCKYTSVNLLSERTSFFLNCRYFRRVVLNQIYRNVRVGKFCWLAR